MLNKIRYIIFKSWLLLISIIVGVIILFGIPRLYILNILFEIEGGTFFYVFTFLFIWAFSWLLSIITSSLVNSRLREKGLKFKKRLVYSILILFISYLPIYIFTFPRLKESINKRQLIESIEKQHIREDFDTYTFPDLSLKEYYVIYNHVFQLPEISEKSQNIRLELMPGDGMQDDIFILLEYIVSNNIFIDSISKGRNDFYPEINQSFIEKDSIKIVSWSYRQI